MDGPDRRLCAEWRGKESLEFYAEMVPSECRPYIHVTFIVEIFVCSHSDLMDTSRDHFRSHAMLNVPIEGIERTFPEPSESTNRYHLLGHRPSLFA
jgi:hypothetical protein